MALDLIDLLIHIILIEIPRNIQILFEQLLHIKLFKLGLLKIRSHSVRLYILDQSSHYGLLGLIFCFC